MDKGRRLKVLLAAQLTCLVAPAILNLWAVAQAWAHRSTPPSDALRLSLIAAVLHGLIATAGVFLLLWARRRDRRRAIQLFDH